MKPRITFHDGYWWVPYPGTNWRQRCRELSTAMCLARYWNNPVIVTTHFK